MGRLTLAIIIASAAAGCFPIGASAQAASSAELSHGPAAKTPVDWGLLFFFGRKVTRVKVLLTDDGERFLRRRLRMDDRGLVTPMHGADSDERRDSRAAADSAFRYETTDPMVLDIVQASLDMPLRVAFPDREDVGVGTGDFTYDLGEIEIVTTKDRFSVGITTKGFCLGRDFQGPRNVFYGWGLAKVLEDMLFERTGKRLPEPLFAVLSGERAISGRKRHYDEIRQRHLSRRPDGGTSTTQEH